MIRRIVVNNLIALITGVVLYFLHTLIISSFQLKLSFSLISIYLFFTIAAIIIISGLELLFEYLASTAGYAFLVSVFLKMGIFVLLFFAGGMAEKSLTMIDKFSILIPLFIFMGIETSVVIKRLKS
jgi:hypothetical protein